MRRCPITYKLINDQEYYSQSGLRQLSYQLHALEPLGFSAQEQRAEAVARAGKMSVQGVQTKLSARLRIQETRFEIVDDRGHYILKPQSEYYPELPENEAVTMSLAALIGIDVPVHGLVYSKDNSMTYFIKRFDREGNKVKISMEDFAQLSLHTRATKYDSSMEKVAEIIERFCTFPRIELVKLFKLTLFNFLVGNEDMHLKNFSLVTKDNKILLSPAYDLLNTTIAQENTKEQVALPINGKRNNLKKKDFLVYFAGRLELNEIIIREIIATIKTAYPEWIALINCSFMSQSMKDAYLKLLQDRYDLVIC